MKHLRDPERKSLFGRSANAKMTHRHLKQMFFKGVKYLNVEEYNFELLLLFLFSVISDYKYKCR